MSLPSIQRVATIQRTVAQAYGIPPRMMKHHDRRRNVSWPRQVAMYLVRDITGKSLPCIGRMFGGRDHTTILHGIESVKRRMETVTDYRADVEAIRARLA